jgi:thioredoxin-related protein
MKLFQSTLIALSLATVAVVSANAEEKKAEKPKPYTLTTCVVSDEKLGEMGKPYVFVQDGREVKLCCESCKKDFKKDPAKFMKKIDAAEKAAKK